MKLDLKFTESLHFMKIYCTSESLLFMKIYCNLVAWRFSKSCVYIFKFDLE